MSLVHCFGVFLNGILSSIILLLISFNTQRMPKPQPECEHFEDHQIVDITVIPFVPCLIF